MTTSGEISAAPPDWATMDREILCPLCEYNLRGLIEPRCPECGHAFEWSDMLARGDWEHPWLFEHVRKRKIRSFLRTFFTSQFPRRFWSSVRPVNTPRVKRLIAYWAILTLLFVIPALVARAKPLFDYYQARQAYLQRMIPSIQASIGTDPVLAEEVRKAGSAQALAERDYSLIPSLPWWFWERVSTGIYLLAQLAIGAMLWPWLTLASLLLFRWSLREAKIKTAHVMRCAFYASDSLPMIAFAAAWGLSVCAAIRMEQHYSINGRTILFKWTGMLVLGAIYALVTYRLTVSYRQYLRFPHALATCASSQLIVLLTLLYLSPWGWVF